MFRLLSLPHSTTTFAMLQEVKAMGVWFDTVFLPSIYERVKERGGGAIWLTVKQTSVCIANMESHSACYSTSVPAERTNSLYYTHEWQGRGVRLDYSKKNGCGCISFGITDEEYRERCSAAMKQAETDELERIRKGKERAARDPHFAERRAAARRACERTANEWADEVAYCEEIGDAEGAEDARRQHAYWVRKLAAYDA